jgi:hypothetical protein
MVSVFPSGPTLQMCSSHKIVTEAASEIVAQECNDQDPRSSSSRRNRLGCDGRACKPCSGMSSATTNGPGSFSVKTTGPKWAFGHLKWGWVTSRACLGDLEKHQIWYPPIRFLKCRLVVPPVFGRVFYFVHNLQFRLF